MAEQFDPPKRTRPPTPGFRYNPIEVVKEFLNEIDSFTTRHRIAESSFELRYGYRHMVKNLRLGYSIKDETMEKVEKAMEKADIALAHRGELAELALRRLGERRKERKERENRVGT